MGLYLNPGKQAFRIATNSEIFVDKTEMIGYLNSLINTNQRYVSVSRPRRFGKTMAVDMISAYYDREADSRDLFTNRKLAEMHPLMVEQGMISWDTYLGQFDVIRLVMTKFFKKTIRVANAISKLQESVIRDLQKAYPDVKLLDEHDLIQSIEDIYSEKDRQIVLVIDEWDAVFRVRKNDREGQTEYLDFLRDLMKDNIHIALAYMTGILPIKKYGEHSALNMFDEYSMISPKELASFVGFTAEEVEEICREKELNYDSMKAWYDGYRLSNLPSEELIQDGKTLPGYNAYEIYSPLSVVSAARFKKLENYWNKSENYEALADFIRRDYDGLKEAVALLMDGGRLKIDTSSYQNDMTTFTGRDDVLSLLIHLGYLGFDDEERKVFVPNKEILDEFRTSTKGNEWTETFRAYEVSEELLQATWNEESDKVAELMELAHNRAGNKTYNNEAALSYSIQLAYYAAQKYYTTILELDTGKGFADVVYIPAPGYPDKPVLLIELKYNHSADTALSQIRRQKYPERLEHYKGKILLIGVNYDRDAPNDDPAFKHHTCTIERA